MSDCIEHTGYVGSNGYGQKKYRGRVVAAHRLAYALANSLDVFTMGGSVLHSCDNPRCVNPEHLRLGTHTENMREMCTRRRNRKSQKLSDAALAHVLAVGVVGTRHSPGNVQELALQYHVHRETIVGVLRGRTYRHSVST